MFRVSLGEYQVCCQSDSYPDLLDEDRQRAALAEHFEAANSVGSAVCFVSVSRLFEWPFLVVTQRFSPAVAGFHPGCLLIPETNTLFIGAGTRLLGYDLAQPRRLWEDEADTGFWSWCRHGSAVLMSAELELAAWDTHGRKLWTRFVEPPWAYTVSGDAIRLDVMGDVSHLRLETGERI